ncbi:RNA polymerase subunit sigma [Bacillus canaveralius]|uniref:RNA polymerase sigma factor n=1 Tax=Bacillus canaveralius TaxID=1403243 RepID=A0A2N5GPF9_9BACI|nr:RNA polymerase sigma factor [Bacillus canaveralius]PLR84432.1 RNA polymerase subunit sigma [Bacillus canaveralius]PLS00566.1 RNA polymerase subunit sigma [Bacillus canaveralius]RSK57851.1 RNA polymerase sigma factor [Bacillus canaveralius]
MDAGRHIEKWFFQYERDITNYLVYYTGSRDVEDIVQDTFLRALLAFPRFRNDADPKTWLISIARNTAIDSFRRKSLWQKLKQSLNSSQNEPESSADKNLLQKEEQLELHLAINRLKENYRDVVLLRGIAELSAAETARVLGWSTNKVNVTFHRAVQKLNTLLKEGAMDVRPNRKTASSKAE